MIKIKAQKVQVYLIFSVATDILKRLKKYLKYS